MSEIIIQIYEVQKPCEAEKLIEMGIDHIGSVVLSKEEWKNSLLKETIDLVGKSNAKSCLIPLFNDLDAVCKVLDYYRPDIIHFCETLIRSNGNGYEVSDHCEALIDLQDNIKKQFPEILVMRSIPIPIPDMENSMPIVSLSSMFEPISDYFLIDTLLPDGSGTTDIDQPVNGFVGITGRTCDWHMASKLVKSSNIPVILAGGISPDNVSDGIVTVNPSGIDSCTNTNATDVKGRPIRFKKNFNKVKQLVEAVRKLELM